MSYFADYYDGMSAQKQRVGLSVDDGEYGHVVELELPDGEHLVLWPVRRVRSLPDQSAFEELTCGLDTGAPERLVIKDPHAIEMLAGVCPNLFRPVRRPAVVKRAVFVSVVCAALLAALLMVFLPGLASVLAGRMSPEAEERFGEIAFEQTRSAFTQGLQPLPICNEPSGQAAYEKLARRVVGDVNLPYALKNSILDDRANPTLNAYVVPGGYVTFFNSMLQAAESPEEIAAVYAHELAHVVNKDPVKGTLESASAVMILSLLAGDISGGGLLGGFMGQLVTSSYSRDAEVEADRYAKAQLEAVGLPPSALGTMFVRLRDEYGEAEGVMRVLSTHPQLTLRIEAAGPDTGAAFEPVLSPAEWAALRNICSSHKKEATGADEVSQLLEGLLE